MLQVQYVSEAERCRALCCDGRCDQCRGCGSEAFQVGSSRRGGWVRRAPHGISMSLDVVQ